MMRGVQTIVDYVNDQPNWSSPQDELLRRLASKYPWVDMRSGLGFFLQWLHGNLVRRRAEPMPVYPRFARIFRDLIAESSDLAALFQITESELDYRADVTPEQRLQVEEFARQNFRPETVD